MTLRDLLNDLAKPDHITSDEALDLEVEFCTIDRCGLGLLSVHESDGRVFIDIGTTQDIGIRNNVLKTIKPYDVFRGIMRFSFK